MTFVIYRTVLELIFGKVMSTCCIAFIFCISYVAYFLRNIGHRYFHVFWPEKSYIHIFWSDVSPGRPAMMRFLLDL